MGKPRILDPFLFLVHTEILEQFRGGERFETDDFQAREQLNVEIAEQPIAGDAAQ
jgi:hypothetical protein